MFVVFNMLNEHTVYDGVPCQPRMFTTLSEANSNALYRAHTYNRTFYIAHVIARADQPASPAAELKEVQD